MALFVGERGNGRTRGSSRCRCGCAVEVVGVAEGANIVTDDDEVVRVTDDGEVAEGDGRR